MSSFAPSSSLYLLLVPVGLVVAGWLSRVQNRKLDRAAGKGGWTLISSKSRWLFRVRLVLRLAAIGGLLVAVAGSRRAIPGLAPAAQAMPRVVFVVDVSRSMLAADILPDRLTQAQKVITETVRRLSGEEVGIVAFAGNAQLHLPLTTDYGAVERACQALAPSLVGRQGTSLAEALGVAGQVLVASREHPRRLLCLLSDGESHSAGYAVLADSLRRAGVELVVVGVGTPAGSFIPVGSPGSSPSGFKTTRSGQPILSRLHEDQLLRLVQGQPDHYTRLGSWQRTVPMLLKHIQGPPPKHAWASADDDKPFAGYQLWLLVSLGLLVVELLLPTGFSASKP
ncbi:VWA domain-containing protein [Hymenobacter sp. UYCo722]|uniref:vWA domain-containing protein n=1 Tax=Hymenobacter sp. UYCo722 TaxID=3156335 RepID=UPI003398E140